MSSILLLLLACSTDPPSSVPAAAPVPAVAQAPEAGPVTRWEQVRLADGARSESAGGSMPTAWRNARGDVACPVMGMAIHKPDEAVSYADHAGKRYFFCCDSCEKLFLADPETYANGRYVDEHKLDPTSAACEELEG